MPNQARGVEPFVQQHTVTGKAGTYKKAPAQGLALPQPITAPFLSLGIWEITCLR